MEKLVRRINFSGHSTEETRQILKREWLLANGLGGYASGTIAGSVSWRYHGLLVAALPAPLGRTVMLNHLSERLRVGDELIQIGGEELSETAEKQYLVEFRLENQRPVWRYEIGKIILEKTVLLIHGQNTVHVTYHLLEGASGVHLEVRPSIHFRSHEDAVNQAMETEYHCAITGKQFEITGPKAIPSLRVKVMAEQSRFTHDGGSEREIHYQKEADRGYASRGHLWSPGYFGFEILSGRSATLIGSTEPWSTIAALGPEEAMTADEERRRRLLSMAPEEMRGGMGGELILAADQFIITPAGRAEDAARARAAGDEVRTVIAGYHWFTDWGRDTMISLEGLTLATGRHAEAGWILRTFAHYIRDGLIPNMFPEGENEGLYHTADATLWFFHALERYVEVTGDRATLRLILPKLLDVIRAHVRGTRFGIRVDPEDGLLRQGEEGYQLTWMDAKVEDWVVTPRRGKAVEINALWYNALRLMEKWVNAENPDDATGFLRELAEKARASFNRRFWYAEGKYLYDVIDGEKGDDPSFRPNQVLAISLEHPILEKEHWPAVLQAVEERLFTPVGLRSLARDHRDFKSRYFGDLRARDAAYHQGTVWAWLIGPFVDAWLKVHPGEERKAGQFLKGFEAHLDEACVGSISEIFDAESPYTPRGCIAQAWSVGEVLRCLGKTGYYGRPGSRVERRENKVQSAVLAG